MENKVGLVGPNQVISIPIPTNLSETLARQVDRLIAVGAFKVVKANRDKYRDELMEIANTFVWRPELAAIGLDQVALVDYRLSGRFLAEVGGVTTFANSAPNEYHNCKGIITPNSAIVIQAQWGSKHQSKKPFLDPKNFHVFEQGGVVKEGLTAFLFEGEKLIKECSMCLCGSVHHDGPVPYFSWCGNRPEINDYYGAVNADGLYFGYVSRGK